jgi:DNA-binding SARP family transcriptional activator
LAAAYRAAVAQRLVQLGDEAAARESLARQWLGFDPFDEDALAALADALRAQGRSGEARRAIDEFAQRLERELAVEPSARVRALASGETIEPIPVSSDAAPSCSKCRRWLLANNAVC